MPDGSALAHTLPWVHSDPVIVLNGDSFCPIPYAELLSSHIDSEAIITIVGVPPAERTDVGAIRANTKKNLILEFAERTQTPGAAFTHVNTGIYAMSPSALAGVNAAVPLPLESDVFLALSASARCFVFPVSGPLVDIGTLDGLPAASHLLRSAT